MDELCRCGKELEAIQNITVTCEQLAFTDYVKRHYGLARVIHQKLAEAADFIIDKSPYYKYVPANVERQFKAVMEPQHTYGQNDTF